jgi:hypothetical protein
MTCPSKILIADDELRPSRLEVRRKSQAKTVAAQKV